MNDRLGFVVFYLGDAKPGGIDRAIDKLTISQGDLALLAPDRCGFLLGQVSLGRQLGLGPGQLHLPGLLLAQVPLALQSGGGGGQQPAILVCRGGGHWGAAALFC